MLGLSKFGTITHISAGKKAGWIEKRKRAMQEKIRGDIESQADLNDVNSEQKESYCIRTTTIVLVENE